MNWGISSLVILFSSQLSWTLVSNESDRQGLAIDYPSLTMHGIVTHDPKYPEAHLVVIVQKSKDEDNDDEPENEDRSGSPVEYDAIETVNYRFVMGNAEDLRFAYQTIADCQALHPDPLDDVVEDDEAGSGTYRTVSSLNLFTSSLDRY